MALPDIKGTLSSIAKTIPAQLFGPDRVSFLSENVIDRMRPEDKSVIREFLNKVLTEMIEREASDIEMGGAGSGGFTWFRIFGKKGRIKEIPHFTDDESAIIILNLLNANQRKYLIKEHNLDFSHTFLYERKNVNVRFRADAYFDLDTITMNMRSISTNVRPLASLELHPNVIKTMSHSYVKFGMSLVTGITGSGKSSTLDSIIDDHNNKEPIHIVVIASPIEFVHKSNIALIKHREVGRDVDSFKDGVIQALRQDPDIIVIGEMRDSETILAALEVTDTGHKVFSTLHTSSAVESIDRIVAEVNPNEQERVRNRLADVLVSVISQKLVPSLDGKRVLAKEVLLINPNVKAAIKNNNTSEIYMMINQGSAQGMITMEQDLKRLYLNKKISLDTAMAFANNKTRLQQILSLT